MGAKSSIVHRYQIEVDDDIVEFKHNTVSGMYQLKVNGQKVRETRRLVDSGTKMTHMLASGKTVKVRVKLSWLSSFTTSFEIDGEPVSQEGIAKSILEVRMGHDEPRPTSRFGTVLNAESLKVARE